MNRNSHLTVSVAFGATIVLALICGSARAMFMRPDEVPVERLISNTAAYVKEHPDDPRGYYTLARIHNLAYTLKAAKLRVYQRNGQLPTVPDMFNQVPRGPRPDAPKAPADAPTEEQLHEHLVASITNYRKAIEMKPKDGLNHLGLAVILEVGAERAPQFGLPPGEKLAKEPTPEQTQRINALIDKLDTPRAAERDEVLKQLQAEAPAAIPIALARGKDAPPETRGRLSALLTGFWKQRAAESYLAAFDLASPADEKVKAKPIEGLNSLVSYEAGNGYLRLADKDPAEAAAKKQRETVAVAVARMDKLPFGPITPIIFSFAEQQRIHDLLAPDHPATRVKFDLDGLGRGQQWPWVKPTTGILVWDPKHSGKITSGRQLFGSITFFMLWENGYQALDALDDNRDGELTGDELVGLSVWFDRNGNGISDPGEVIPVDQAGIEAVSARATGIDGISPSNPAGLRLRSGHKIPSYDWVVSPAK